MRVLSWIARVTLVLFAVRVGRRRPAPRPAPAKPATPPDPDGQKELSEASSAELVASTFSVDELIGRLFERQLPPRR